jgi:hypothetical protein
MNGERLDLRQLVYIHIEKLPEVSPQPREYLARGVGFLFRTTPITGTCP